MPRIGDENGRSVWELRNLATAPASDDALVGALLEFANGATVLISGQDARYGEPRTREADRPAYSRLLGAVVDGRDGPMPMLTDSAGRRRPAFAAIRFGRARRALPPVLRGATAVVSERVLIGRPRGYSLGYFRQFKRAASALAEAALLVLDPDKPYAAALSRCQWPDCQKFYLARKNPRGGPANRTYCNPEHRRLHNTATRDQRGRQE